MDNDQPHPSRGNPTCFDVFHHAAYWVIALALEAGRRGRNAGIGGFTLHPLEMEAINLPIYGIVSLLAGEQPLAEPPPARPGVLALRHPLL